MTEDLSGGEENSRAAELDFALLAFAPVMVRTPGSFSLWAALARVGPVVSACNHAGTSALWGWVKADLGGEWKWSCGTPLLLREVAVHHGFTFDDPAPWIRWLETH
eukprot:gnl/TRDRNA2_/TRDRNA2_158214_c0_seq4.p4 gnl/TRDRNA2_/TRDRNA2_158214_c0~~gnl/TRDRNA2_/TRDRNA2_158214_c0_seq4.p4  ORF type:complete len:106 (+),score=14.54 gnl/TRDRNA2_/TRDRNA2_158214_c0_seq4:760-1077(+)